MGIMAPDDTGAWKMFQSRNDFYMDAKENMLSRHQKDLVSIIKYNVGDDEIGDSDDAEDNRDLVSLC